MPSKLRQEWESKVCEINQIAYIERVHEDISLIDEADVEWAREIRQILDKYVLPYMAVREFENLIERGPNP